MVFVDLTNFFLGGQPSSVRKDSVSKNKRIILAAICLAMLIVLSRFLSIKTPILKISFAFVPTMLCATYLGWKWSVLINILGDLVGALLFPTGPYFVGYTITTAIAGLIYGILLYKSTPTAIPERKFIFRTIASVILVAVIVNMGLNTLCLSITMGKAFLPLFWMRLLKQIIMVPVHIVIFLFIEKALQEVALSYLYNGESHDQGAKSEV